jgi:hypothetical protein
MEAVVASGIELSSVVFMRSKGGKGRKRLESSIPTMGAEPCANDKAKSLQNMSTSSSAEGRELSVGAWTPPLSRSYPFHIGVSGPTHLGPVHLICERRVAACWAAVPEPECVSLFRTPMDFIGIPFRIAVDFIGILHQSYRRRGVATKRNNPMRIYRLRSGLENVYPTRQSAYLTNPALPSHVTSLTPPSPLHLNPPLYEQGFGVGIP